MINVGNVERKFEVISITIWIVLFFIILIINLSEAAEFEPNANQSIKMKDVYGVIWETDIPDAIRDIFVSPDGEIIAVIDNYNSDGIFLQDKEGKLRWKQDLNFSGRFFAESYTYLIFDSLGSSISVSSNVSYIALLDINSVYFFSKETGLLWKYDLPKNLKVDQSGEKKIMISSDGSYVAVIWNKEIIYFFNKKGKLLWKYESEPSKTTIGQDNLSISESSSYISLYSSISPDGSYVAAGFSYYNSSFYNRSYLTSGFEYSNFKYINTSLGIAYYNSSFESIHKVVLFDREGKPLWDHETDSTGISISSDGSYIAIGDFPNHGLPREEVILFNKEGEIIWKKNIKGGFDQFFVFPDGSTVGVQDFEKSQEEEKYVGIIYYFSNEGDLLWKYKTGTIDDVLISSDKIIVSDRDKNLHFFNKRGLLWNHTFQESISDIYASSDASHMVLASKTIPFIDKEGRLINKYELEDSLSTLSISSNGKYVAIATHKSYINSKIIFLERMSEFTNMEKWFEIENVSIFDYGTSIEFDQKPVNITNNFIISDTSIHLWAYLGVSNLGNELKWKIYSPDGMLYFNPSINLDQYYKPVNNWPENVKRIHTLHYEIPQDKIVDKPGEWHADIYVNDRKALTHSFYIPGTISATWYPAIGFILSTFPLFGAIFMSMNLRKKQAKLRVGLIENWKANGLMTGHFIAIIWALILITFLFLKKFQDGEMNAALSYVLFITSVIFCFFSTKMMHNFLNYRKLSKNDLYFNGSLSMSIAILALFSGAFVPAPISEAALLSFGIVLIPLFAQNFISLYVVKNNGELLLAKEARIPVTPAFPQELLRFYKDSEYIGGGGFAWVFKATRKDGIKVAVKIPAIKDEKTGNLFLREVANWSALEHENIVKFYNANIFPVPLLEMELCDSSLAPGKRTIQEALSIIYEIAKGLEYAHEQKLIHADIKHSNILLKDGKIKISDWGLSKVKKGRSLSVSALTINISSE